MSKILYIASTFGHLTAFHPPYIRDLSDKGHDIHIAGAGAEGREYSHPVIAHLYRKRGISEVIDVPFEKRFISKQNLKCVDFLAELLQKERYDIVLVHTSLAAFLLRIAARKAFGQNAEVKGLKDGRPFIINTVHGYLFDEYTPHLKRTILLWAEKLTRNETDRLIVMNQQDLDIAYRYQLCRNISEILKIDGMGFDEKKFNPAKVAQRFEEAGLSRKQIFESLGLPFESSDFVMIYAAEFSRRKNQKMLIKAMAKLPKQMKLILAGQGSLLEECRSLSEKLGLADRIHFAGHVPNLEDYYYCSDICVSASRSEGLPLNLMEALAMGLPLLASAVKGNEDLVKNGANGLLFAFDDVNDFCQKAMDFYNAAASDGKQPTVSGHLCLKDMQKCARTSVTRYALPNVRDYYSALITFPFAYCFNAYDKPAVYDPPEEES